MHKESYHKLMMLFWELEALKQEKFTLNMKVMPIKIQFIL